MNNDAVAKIKMMRASIRCFVYGLLGFLPLIGFAFGLAALRNSGIARVEERHFWNPARVYRICGIISAALALIFWSFILILIVWHVLNPSPNYN